LQEKIEIRDRWGEETAMKQRGSRWFAAAILGILSLCSAQAQGPGAGFGQHRPPVERAFGQQGHAGRWWNNPNLIDRLKLTDTQRKSMDGILLQHRETLIDLRGNLQKAELLLEPLMRDDQPNEGKILAQIDKVAQARAELEKANARFLLEIRGTLAPDQWKQVQEIRADRKFNQDGSRPAWGQREPGHGAGQEGFRHGQNRLRRGDQPPPLGDGAQAPNPDGNDLPPASEK
jgi:Spy/CpxP family protein refolding chaperone